MDKAKNLVFIIALPAFAAGVLWGNYRWHEGFTAGADTVLCVIGHRVDGPEAAMRSDPCLNIKGRDVPWLPYSLRPQGPPAQTYSTKKQDGS